MNMQLTNVLYLCKDVAKTAAKMFLCKLHLMSFMQHIAFMVKEIQGEVLMEKN